MKKGHLSADTLQQDHLPSCGLALLAGVYLYGFTAYSFRMSDLEAALDAQPLYIAPFFTAAAVSPEKALARSSTAPWKRMRSRKA